MPINKNKAFTLVEILIAAGVLTLFMGGVFSVFFGGQRMGNNAYWTQHIVNSLRNACRHISDNVKKSSYPSTIIYPGQVFENTGDSFKLQFTSRITTFATETADITGTSAPGTYLLAFPESVPEKQMFETNTPGVIRYHIYSLTKRGKLLYHIYENNNVVTTSPDYARSISITGFPPGTAGLLRSSVIIEDVESVRISPQVENAVSPVTLSITCRYTRGETRRTEQATIVPNIANIKRTAGSGNW